MTSLDLGDLQPLDEAISAPRGRQRSRQTALPQDLARVPHGMPDGRHRAVVRRRSASNRALVRGLLARHAWISTAI
ncbi:MAG: hypothetical protein KF764_15785 [Labilithrix sp.]|nr:hypothetical protein [Labilithrix sp.]